MKKRFVNITLALLLALNALPMAVATALAEEQTKGKIDFTDTDVQTTYQTTTDGLTWNGDQKTLAMNGAALTIAIDDAALSGDAAIALKLPQDTTLNVTGTNTLTVKYTGTSSTATLTALGSMGNMVISGKGTLTVKFVDATSVTTYGIAADGGALEVYNTNLNVTANKYCYYATKANGYGHALDLGGGEMTATIEGGNASTDNGTYGYYASTGDIFVEAAATKMTATGGARAVYAADGSVELKDITLNASAAVSAVWAKDNITFDGGNYILSSAGGSDITDYGVFAEVGGVSVKDGANVTVASANRAMKMTGALSYNEYCEVKAGDSADTATDTTYATQKYVAFTFTKKPLADKIAEAETLLTKLGQPVAIAELTGDINKAKAVYEDATSTYAQVSAATADLTTGMADAKTMETALSPDFSEYKTTVLKNLLDLMKDDDSVACHALYDQARQDIINIVKDENLSLKENQDRVDAVYNQFVIDLEYQRSQDILNNDLAVFTAYRNEKIDACCDLAEDGDSEAVQAIIAAAVDKLSATEYDLTKTLRENEAALDEIYSSAITDVAVQRALDVNAENIAAYNALKEEKLSACDALAQATDSDACKQLITKAKQDITNREYNTLLTAEENATQLSSIVSRLSLNLQTQRKKEQSETQIAEFEAYKTEKVIAAAVMAYSDDSDACKQLIETAKTTITNMQYDVNKTLDENKSAVDKVLSKLSDDLIVQRAIDKGGNSDEPKTEEGLSGGAIAGIVIGSIVGVAAIGAALYYFVFRRKEKKSDF